MINAHSNGSYSLACDQCRKSTPEKAHLDQVLLDAFKMGFKQVSGANEQYSRFLCEGCFATYPEKDNLFVISIV